ncbi:MAG: hypothetical protein ACT4N8_00635 [Sphingosinicella sp.]|uniref:hypothetical protein n=1 Tax=Sphingosinicella sp. TaxID=1917971 RepID=UPI0040383155
MSEAITRLLTLAHSRGLVSEEADWSKAKVHHFTTVMPSDIRAAGEADLGLDYYRQDSDTHYAFDEGFIDREAKVAVSFPLETQTRA